MAAPPPGRPKAKGLRAIPGRFGRALINLGSDTWYVVSAPARLNRRNVLTLAGIAAVEGTLYAYDEELYEAALRSDGNAAWDAVIDVGETIEPIGFMARAFKFYAGTWVVGTAFRVKPMQAIAVQLTESHLIAGGIRNSMKYLVGRKHPYDLKGSRFFSFNGGTSFPSGHTSIYFEQATVLSHHLRSKPATVVLYSLAVIGGIQRVHGKAHWPSDVFLPAISGTLIARTVVRRNEERAARDAGTVGAVDWHPDVRFVDGTMVVGVGAGF